MKTYEGMEVPHHSWLRHEMEVSDQFHAMAALPWGKNPQYPLYRRLDGPQSWPGRCGEKRNLLPLPGMELWPSSP
jgi:hypothetical protein